MKLNKENAYTGYFNGMKKTTNGKILLESPSDVRKITTVRYIGESDDNYTNGNVYNVIDVSP